MQAMNDRLGRLEQDQQHHDLPFGSDDTDQGAQRAGGGDPKKRHRGCLASIKEAMMMVKI